MIKSLAFRSLVATGLSLAAIGPALALQARVTQIDSNSDGTKTYHFAITVEPGDMLMPGAAGKGDFVTIYNFYGLVDGSVKTPAGWTFSSEEFGRTPVMNGYPMVLPVDIPNTPNLTWSVDKPITAGTTIQGFTAVTKMTTVTDGEYSAQVTHEAPMPTGAPAGASTAKTSKQALIGTLPAPSFLAKTQ